MKTLIAILLFAVFVASAQTMPTYVAGGVAFNQLGTPRVNAFVSALAPVSSQKGVYESTTADLVPVTKYDPVTKRNVYTFSSQIRQGLHKTLYTAEKWQLMLGGDIGGSFAAAPEGATGINVSLAGSVTGTFVYQINPHWAAIVPVRGLYTASFGGWNLIPEVGIVWKP
jgi:hypothetical protein